MVFMNICLKNENTIFGGFSSNNEKCPNALFRVFVTACCKKSKSIMIILKKCEKNAESTILNFCICGRENAESVIIWFSLKI